jgi:uncharacterized protein
VLIYLHGFRSSPSSAKATLIRARMEALGRAGEFVCPQLPASPRAAVDAAMATRPGECDTVVGSSLGGFYATWVAERTGARCVLLNPSTDPVASIGPLVGTYTMFHSDEPFEFRREYVDELRAFYAGPITRPERYFLVAAKGDELLDWRDMVARYPGAKLRLLECSDHGISDFADYLDEVLEFAGTPVR